MTDSTKDEVSTGEDRIDYERRRPKRRSPEEIRFRGPDGVLQKAELVIRDEARLRHGLAVRPVAVNGSTLVQKYAPALPGGVRPDAYRRLDAEARALCRLVQVWAARFPPELPRIVGYNVDAAEPFLLLEPPHGRPVSEIYRQFDSSDKVAFQQGLLRALALVERAGIVHGAVELGSVHWDGATVQLVDFDAAAPRGSGNVGVDVLAAGTVIRQVALGPRASADWRNDPVALKELLAGLLDPDPGKRPGFVELLGRLHTPLPQVRFHDPDTDFAAARKEFDDVCTRKRGGPSTDPLGLAAIDDLPPTPARSRTLAYGRARTVLVPILLLVVVAVVIGYLVVLG